MEREVDLNERIRWINKSIHNSKLKERMLKELMRDYDQLRRREDKGDKPEDTGVESKGVHIDP